MQIESIKTNCMRTDTSKDGSLSPSFPVLCSNAERLWAPNAQSLPLHKWQRAVAGIWFIPVTRVFWISSLKKIHSCYERHERRKIWVDPWKWMMNRSLKRFVHEPSITTASFHWDATLLQLDTSKKSLFCIFLYI